MQYTLPALAIYEIDHDGNEELKEVIMESSRIAAFLDDKYQERKLIRGSPASQAAQRELIAMVNKVLYPALAPLFAPSVVNYLSPRSAAYYRGMRETKFGCELEELVATTDIVKGAWAKLEAALDTLATFLAKSVAEGKMVLKAAEMDEIEGQVTNMEPTYAALVLAAAFVGLEEVGFAGTWERVRTCNDGKWNGIRALCEQYAY